jgi:cell division protein FtsZ
MVQTSTPIDIANVHKPVLKVLGLGGGGCNAVERMIALEKNPAPVKIQLGPRSTRGLGAGGDPRVGMEAAKESAKEIARALHGADMVFLTAGMGGGTGTGSIPVAAEIARSVGAVTIAVVTTPFSFEMGRRQKNAAEGLARLRKHTNTLISIPNDRLLYIAPRNLSLEVAFRLADDILRQSVQGIAELITEPGMINVDFADIRRLIRLGGGALMAIGQGYGPNKTQDALDQALHHPLLDSVSLDRAAGVIANFTGGDDLTLLEVQESLLKLQSQTGVETEIVLGVNNNPTMEDRVQVILVITGLGAPTLEEAMAGVHKPEPQPVQRPAAADPAPEPLPAGPEMIKFEAEPGEPVVYPATLSSQNLDVPAFLRRRLRAA